MEFVLVETKQIVNWTGWTQAGQAQLKKKGKFFFGKFPYKLWRK